MSSETGVTFTCLKSRATRERLDSSGAQISYNVPHPGSLPFRAYFGRDCERLELSVLDWNPTRDFYHAVNCTRMETWLPYRMEGAAILALAAEAPDIVK